MAGIIDIMASREIDRDALHRMTASLAHRGPDGEGYFICPGVGLGHRRLAVIDPNGGAQPYITSDQTGVITFNGEIYNYRQLKSAINRSGSEITTNSDTELLAEGLACNGAQFLKQLRGVFAFAYYDFRNQRTLLARDRLGEKPLYYALSDNGFLIFASEISPILASGYLKPEHDRTAIADYFFYGFVPDSKTIYKTVHKLPPGAYLEVSRGGDLNIKTYWQLDDTHTTSLSFQQMSDELAERLLDAVNIQMISDVPLGAFLSGGLDSSSIVAVMKSLTDNIVTCSIGFEESDYDETAYASLVASKFGAHYNEEIVRPNDLALIDKLAKAYGEPFGDISALPGYLLAQSARQHVTVALSGDGADELFSGYRRHQFFKQEERLRQLLPKTLRQSFLRPLGSAYPKLDWAPKPLRFKSTLQMLAGSRSNAYAHAIAANYPERSSLMLSEDFRRVLGSYRPQSLVEELMPDPKEPILCSARRVDMLFWLPGRMLTKIDRASMAHGFEVRPPMLDHKFVEWAMTIPHEFRLQASTGKRILRHAMASRLPAEILSRKKQGFSFPLEQWLRLPGGPLDAMLASAAWRHSGIFNEERVTRMADNLRNRRENCAQELWSLIMFDAFLRQ